jgi:hypothetical protein
MSGIVSTLASWLAARTTTGVLIGPGLLWLAHRSIRFIELWLMLRSLPRTDRATAA